MIIYKKNAQLIGSWRKHQINTDNYKKESNGLTSTTTAMQMESFMFFLMSSHLSFLDER